MNDNECPLRIISDKHVSGVFFDLIYGVCRIESVFIELEVIHNDI